jgi:preprotein translocase subunit YajC
MGGAFDLVSLLPIVAIFVVFYFLLIRPQQKKAKEHRALIESVRRGDRVVTGGGILGLVTKVRNDEVDVEIAEGVRVKVKKATIADIPSRTGTAAPATETQNGDARADDEEDEEEAEAARSKRARKS